MLGWPEAGSHLGLVEDPETLPSPTEEDLLVLYLAGPIDDEVIGRLIAAGGERAPPATPTGTRGA